MAGAGYRKISDLPATIPVFPLDGAILLPGAVLPLQIFEPRYLNMVDDAMTGERLIGMIRPGPVAPAPGRGWLGSAAPAGSPAMPRPATGNISSPSPASAGSPPARNLACRLPTARSAPISRPTKGI